jgi:hypothetical protein
VVGQHRAGPADQPRHGLGARDEQHLAEVRGLVRREAPRLAVVVGDLGRGQRRQHVVARVHPPVVDLGEQVLVDLPDRVERRLVDHPDAFLDVEDRIDDVAQLLLVRLGHPEQRGDDGGRHDGPEVLHVVERLGSGLGVEEPAADLADPAVECGHAARRERPGHQGAQAGVLGGIEEDDQAARDGIGAHQLERGAVRRDVGLDVEVGGRHVGVPAQHVEVEPVVVVAGGLVAQAAPERVGSSRSAGSNGSQ